jgi:hypothetical protein
MASTPDAVVTQATTSKGGKTFVLIKSHIKNPSGVAKFIHYAKKKKADTSSQCKRRFPVHQRSSPQLQKLVP